MTNNNTLPQTFEMNLPEHLVLAISGKSNTEKTECANQFILDCISSGGKVLLSTLENSKLTASENLIILQNTNTLFKFFDDIVKFLIDTGFSPTLLVIDDSQKYTKSDVIDLKRFAYGYRCDIIVATSLTDKSEKFDGYLAV